MVGISVIKGAGEHVPGIGKGVLVAQVDAGVGIGSTGAGVIENRPVRGRGYAFFPSTIDALESEIAEGDRGQRTANLVIIRMTGNAIIRLRGVELGKEKRVVSSTSVERARNQEFKLFKFAPIGDRAGGSIERSSVGREL